MTDSLLLTAIILTLAVIIAAAFLLVLPQGGGRDDTLVLDPGRSVLTVRSASGRSITIHAPYVLDEDDESSLKAPGTELTRRLEPDLYREYMSSETSATRKMEIADRLYDMGLVLPYQKDLYADYLRERDRSKTVMKGLEADGSLRELSDKEFE